MRKVSPRRSGPEAGAPMAQAAQARQKERTALSIDGWTPVTARYAQATRALRARAAFFPARGFSASARSETSMPICWPESARIWRHPAFLNDSDSSRERSDRSPVMRATRRPEPENGMRATALLKPPRARARKARAGESKPRDSTPSPSTKTRSPSSGGGARRTSRSPSEGTGRAAPVPVRTRTATRRRAPPVHTGADPVPGLAFDAGPPLTSSIDILMTVPPFLACEGCPVTMPLIAVIRSRGIPNQGRASRKAALRDAAATAMPMPIAVNVRPALSVRVHASRFDGAGTKGTGRFLSTVPPLRPPRKAF